jgi:tagatose 6-phosphate kinase
VILTVTLNPALDLTYQVGALKPYGTHRVTEVAERAGGKGLNVARVLHAAGEPVLATGLLGGDLGARIGRLLAADGVPGDFLAITGESRRTVAVVDAEDATGFWEPGPAVTPAEWEVFCVHYASLLPTADVVVLSGSLPSGLPMDAYATLVRLAREQGVTSVLDTSGDALLAGVTAGPDVVKPNRDELAALAGLRAAAGSEPAEPGAGPERPAETAWSGVAGAQPEWPAEAAEPGAGPEPAEWGAQLGAGAEWLRELGAGAVVASAGPEGFFAFTGSGRWRALPPEVVAGNPTGAGDASVAALARGLAADLPWPEILADAVALSAAAVAAPVAGAVDLPTMTRLRPLARVTPVA